MLRLFFVMTMALLFSISGVVSAAPSATPTVAVIPFGLKAAVSRDVTLEDATIVSDYVYDALVNSGAFDVVERDRLEEIMKEQVLGHSGPVDDRTAAEFGRLVGAKYIVCGSITGLASDEACYLDEDERYYLQAWHSSDEGAPVYYEKLFIKRMPHAVNPVELEYAWNFIKRFSRNADGSLTITEQE